MDQLSFELPSVPCPSSQPGTGRRPSVQPKKGRFGAIDNGELQLILIRTVHEASSSLRVQREFAAEKENDKGPIRAGCWGMIGHSPHLCRARLKGLQQVGALA